MATASAQRLPRWFGVSMALAAVAVLISGFTPSFYARPSSMPALRGIVIAHGAMFSSWIGLFVAQTSLVATHRVRVHRLLGYAGVGLSTLMVAMAPPLAIGLARRGQPEGDPLMFLLVLLVDVLSFGTLVGAAVYFRKRGETHRRLMLLAMATLLPPAISRWPIAVRHTVPTVLSVMLVFLLAAPAADLIGRRRPHPVSMWGALAILVSLPLRFAVGQTAAWHAIARWLVS